MKKFGFTLAEILVSLAIIGIVATITIPTLGTNARKQANLATLKSTVSDFENAFSAMMIAKGKDTLDDVENWFSEDVLSNYMKVSNGKTKNGTSYRIIESRNLLELDLNGFNNKPNKDGVDRYMLVIDEYGLIDISEYTSED